jgi:hypothetical protein
MGQVPGEGERQAVTLGDLEVGHGSEVLAVVLDWGPQHQGLGAGDGQQCLADPAYPGGQAPVVEADAQLHPHRYPAPDPLDHPDHVGVGQARGHEVDHPDGAVLGLELGLQDQAVALVATPDPLDPAGRGDPPVPVALVAEQGREAGAGVKARKAQPVDRAVAAHQGRRLGVGDDRVVLDLRRQAGVPSPYPAPNAHLEVRRGWPTRPPQVKTGHGIRLPGARECARGVGVLMRLEWSPVPTGQNDEGAKQ